MKDKASQLETLRQFVGIYCREKHGRPAGELCPDCQDLLAYASQRLSRCPLDPKPACKDCKIHCYGGDYRRRIQEVMRFSGMYFVKHGRVDWLVKYFMS